MSNQTDQNKIVNANQNNRLSWWNSPDTGDYVQHIPLADLLIQKHCKSWWKNHPETADYQLNQLGICLQLDVPRSSREWKLRILSRFIECDPIVLMNDLSKELKDIR